MHGRKKDFMPHSSETNIGFHQKLHFEDFSMVFKFLFCLFVLSFNLKRFIQTNIEQTIDYITKALNYGVEWLYYYTFQ